MSASVHFSIRYDGPALAAHQMDVRELAPALIALSDLIEHANKAIDPQAPEVQVRVNGDFKGGSFGVDLTAAQTVAQQIIALFSGPESSASANLFGILSGIGLMGGGLVALIKRLRGRRPDEIRIDGERTIFELRTDETTEVLEADLVTGRLYRSRLVRQSLAKVLRPLARDGIERFLAGADRQVAPLVSKAEAAWFDAAASEADVVSDSVQHGVLLQVESAVFRDGNKWRLDDGNGAFYAVLADDAFIARVETGAERFGKGDILVADLRRVQTVTDTGLRVDHTVLRVLEHRAPLQGKLAL